MKPLANLVPFVWFAKGVKGDATAKMIGRGRQKIIIGKKSDGDIYRPMIKSDRRG